MSEYEVSSRTPSAPLPWRVRVCRLLWRVLGFVWGTLIVGIVIATIANFNTTTTDTRLDKLYIVRLVQTYPLPAWSSLGLLATLTLLSWLGSRERQATVARPLSEQDRSHMLRRLRVRYEQLLAQSLQGAVQMELGLTSRPTAVQNAVSLALRLPDQPDYPLPPHTSIAQVYEQAQQELLILGEPGAGKSTLLLKLALYLVEQAEQEAVRPLPILLPLSFWAEHKRPLNEWLGAEVARLYDVPRRLSQQWIQTEQVLLLLDGLDEMEESARIVCITAINTYHREHVQPLVVCSRSNEYTAATRYERLALHTAVVVRPLERRQVDTYLANLGEPLAGLRATLKANPLLQELAVTPLLLQVLMLTYHDTQVRTLSQQEAPLRGQVWIDYVRRMVLSKGDVRRYPLQAIISWLGWLASEMRQHHQAIFFLESLQPDWIPTRQRNLYRWSIGLFRGLVSGLAGGLLFGLSSGVVGGLAVGLASVGLDTPIQLAETLTWSWKTFRNWLILGLVLGLVGGLTSGPDSGLGRGLAFGLAGGLAGGLLGGFSGGQLTAHLRLSPNEGIHRAFKNGLLVFVCWLVGGLIGGLAIGLADFGLGRGLTIGLGIGLAAGLLMGLDAAVQHSFLRFWLVQSGVFPWRTVPFLEDATARILLRRVGGGYSFAHRLLLDFFADASAYLPMQTNASLVPTNTDRRVNDGRK